MIVIGICGRRNTGKDVAADVFGAHFGFVKFPLADPIKRILCDYFDVPEKELWGSSEKRTSRTREMLQALGTDFGRKYDSGVWVRLLQQEIYGRVWSRITIPDVRFPDEAKTIINELKGQIIKIVRPNIEVTKADSHASETAVDTIPEELIYRVIQNDSSLPVFKKRVLKVAKEIMSDAEKLSN